MLTLIVGTSLAVQWLRLCGGAGSVPGWGAKIPHASWPKRQNIKQKQYCKNFNKDFLNGPHQKIKTLKNIDSNVVITCRIYNIK